MPSILNATTTTGLVTSADNSGSLQLATNNGTTAVTIDTSQNVGIGTTSPVNTASAKVLTIYDAIEPRIQFQNSTTGTTSTDGSTIAVAGADLFINNRENGNQLFFVNGAERMRIDSSGALCVGRTTSLYGTEKLHVYNTSNVATFWADTTSDLGAVFVRHQRAGGGLTGAMIQFVNSSGSVVGSINSTSSATSYVTSSDYRLKDNIAPMTGALAVVGQLKPCTYTWKADGSAGQGFIAHELAEVCPDAVTGEKDAVNEDGSIKPQGIDTSFLVATLTAAIQELNAKVDAQALEIQALKSLPTDK
jgi:hypothetical protein